jgi:hypothetical protein
MKKAAWVNNGAVLGLQFGVYVAVYDAIEHGSPFKWGWPDWKALIWCGIIHNRVIMVLNAWV